MVCSRILSNCKMHAILGDRCSARRRRVLLLVLSRSLSLVRAQQYAPDLGPSVSLRQQLAMSGLAARVNPSAPKDTTAQGGAPGGTPYGQGGAYGVARPYAPSSGYGAGVGPAMDHRAPYWAGGGPPSSAGQGGAPGAAAGLNPPHVSNRQVDLTQINVRSVTVDQMPQPVTGDRPGCAPRARSSRERGPGPARRQAGER